MGLLRNLTCKVKALVGYGVPAGLLCKPPDRMSVGLPLFPRRGVLARKGSDFAVWAALATVYTNICFNTRASFPMADEPSVMSNSTKIESSILVRAWRSLSEQATMSSALEALMTKKI